MHELPGQLSADELAELFEGRTQLVKQLATRENPLVAARQVVHELSDEAKREALDAHPSIGARKLSARSAAEQGADADPAANSAAILTGIAGSTNNAVPTATADAPARKNSTASCQV